MPLHCEQKIKDFSSGLMNSEVKKMKVMTVVGTRPEIIRLSKY